MRLIALVFLTAIAAFLISGATKPSDSEAIRATITAQLDAFRLGDDDAAFAIAAPDIQAKFGDAEAFSAMVAEAYPQVYRPQRITFFDLIETDGLLVKQVLITGHNGLETLALYEMIKIDGNWRINGCMLAAPPGRAI